MKFYTLVFAVLMSLHLNAQTQKTKVLTLGTFHFGFPNRDFVQIEEPDQIDVLDEKHQREIKTLVKKLKKFDPTVIVIEKTPSYQPVIDSLFQLYLEGKYELQRSEVDQIAFRLAKEVGVKKLICVNEWGELNNQVDTVLQADNSAAQQRFYDYFEKTKNNPLKYNPSNIFKTEGIIAELIRLNTPENIKKSLGNYLIGPFKYEEEKGDFFGVNFESGRWFNRNLKIFRNIQRIDTDETDRVLVLFGTGHMNILNILFESSPEYELVNTNDYLR
ncbi:DUF5694 domain-containing protein [Sinomicrobium sp.]